MAVLRLFTREPRTVSEAARRLGSSRQGVQRLVNALVQGGWLEARANPRDRRASRFALTEGGRALVAEHARTEARSFNEMAEGLAPDALRAAAALLREIRRRQQRG